MKMLVLQVPDQDEARPRELLAQELPGITLMPSQMIPTEAGPSFEPNVAGF